MIYSGHEFTVRPDVAKKYKFEVIVRKDGYKDYRKIEVQSPYGLDDLISNPAINQVLVHYRVDKNSSTYLMITYAVSGVFNNDILDTEQSQINLNLGNYNTGVYNL